eukprot:Sspe_Gene.3686::Locus_1229_Transcript_1_1_Confidence_1.000_Length_6310::g.3686::m.3686
MCLYSLSQSATESGLSLSIDAGDGVQVRTRTETVKFVGQKTWSAVDSRLDGKFSGSFRAIVSGYLKVDHAGPHVLDFSPSTRGVVAVKLHGEVMGFAPVGVAPEPLEVDLAAGLHPITILKDVKGGDGAELVLEWIPPGGKRAVVPSENLRFDPTDQRTSWNHHNHVATRPCAEAAPEWYTTPQGELKNEAGLCLSSEGLRVELTTIRDPSLAFASIVEEGVELSAVYTVVCKNSTGEVVGKYQAPVRWRWTSTEQGRRRFIATFGVRGGSQLGAGVPLGYQCAEKESPSVDLEFTFTGKEGLSETVRSTCSEDTSHFELQGEAISCSVVTRSDDTNTLQLQPCVGGKHQQWSVDPKGRLQSIMREGDCRPPAVLGCELGDGTLWHHSAHSVDVRPMPSPDIR